jgi:hypothetical protein
MKYFFKKRKKIIILIEFKIKKKKKLSKFDFENYLNINKLYK